MNAPQSVFQSAAFLSPPVSPFFALSPAEATPRHATSTNATVHSRPFRIGISRRVPARLVGPPHGSQGVFEPEPGALGVTLPRVIWVCKWARHATAQGARPGLLHVMFSRLKNVYTRGSQF